MLVLVQMFHFQKDATANLLKDLKTEEKVKEEKEYQQVAVGSEGYVEIATNGGERAHCPFRDSFESNC